MNLGNSGCRLTAMTGTCGQTSGTVIGDRATIDGGRSPPTVTSGTGDEPSSLPPSPSSPSDDEEENSSPLPLEKARTCLHLGENCIIHDAADDTGRRPHSTGTTERKTDPEYNDKGLAESRQAVRPLVADKRQPGSTLRATIGGAAGTRLNAKQSFNLHSSILQTANVVCKTRRGIV